MTKNKRQTSLYEQVVRDLKGKIVSGIYEKGELLPSEKELIEYYHVSRITIRKALSILADMGFVETSQGRGSAVLFDPEHIKEDSDFAKAAEEHYKEFMASTQIRMMLEPEMARIAARTATKEQVQQLKKCLVREENEEQEDFHMTLVSLLDNKILMEIMGRLMEMEQKDILLGTIAPDSQKEVVKIVEQQHRRIYEAIRDRNEEFAYFYMKDHTTYMSKLYEEYYKHLL